MTVSILKILASARRKPDTAILRPYYNPNRSFDRNIMMRFMQFVNAGINITHAFLEVKKSKSFRHEFREFFRANSCNSCPAFSEKTLPSRFKKGVLTPRTAKQSYNAPVRNAQGTMLHFFLEPEKRNS